MTTINHGDAKRVDYGKPAIPWLSVPVMLAGVW
jgi:hypothetical protein